MKYLIKRANTSGSGNENVLLPGLHEIRLAFNDSYINWYLRLIGVLGANEISDTMWYHIIQRAFMIKYLYHLPLRKQLGAGVFKIPDKI